MEKKIKVGWLFPNTFNLHGERGNILALEAEGKRRGYEVGIVHINLDSVDFNPMDYDLLFCPPGEIEHFPAVIDYLKNSRDALISYIENHPILVTGTSIGLFGNQIHREDNRIIKGLGIIDIEINENHAVYGDDLFFRCQYNGKEMEIIGSQIQMMDLDIKEESPFGRLKYGYGNTGKTKFEGVMSGKGIFTNTLGPILVCNPWLTEEIINLIEQNRRWPLWEEHRDNTLELKSLKTKVALISKKESRLTKIDER
jgi:CobQ-like glutamine amidotransferase family enzyme